MFDTSSHHGAAALFSEYVGQDFPIKLFLNVSSCCSRNRTQAPHHQVRRLGMNSCMGVDGTENVSTNLST
ncbi:MAG: hypothetical protein ACKPKO_62445, partial [Candidatus Fonsibacter sp.]